ncbi:hypothetical protein ACV3Q3_13030 [Clostridium perfringens]
MEIENLTEGMEIKNYKELCSVLNIKTKAGNSKKSQLKELERYCNYIKEGNRFIIKEIYKDPKIKEDGRKTNNLGKYKNYKNFKVDNKNYFSKGVYCIVNKNNIYIGSTNRSFRERFLEHYNNYQHSMDHTQNLLLNGGIFKIIEIMNNSNEKVIRLKEQYYINKYLKDNRYNLINKEKEIGYRGKIKPIKYKNIKVAESNYSKAIELLKENNLL